MAAVTILLPTVLEPSVGTTRIRVEADTVQAALEAAYRRHPSLRFHLCEESGEFRAHVLCLHNDRNTRERGSLAIPLGKGDTITIVQAISGG